MKKETVEKAKRIAAKNGKSVSKMVEEYFNKLPEAPKKTFTQLMDELIGPHRERINASLPKGKSYKEIVGDWRYEDYMKKLAERQPKPKGKTKR